MGEKNYLIDMDGVLVSGRQPIPGAAEFLQRLKDRDIKHLVLTNNPMYTPGDLSHRLRTMGLEVPAKHIFTSAMATALFLQSQKPLGKAFVIGESGLTTAIHSVDYVITDINPDYVVLGETMSYNLEMITKAIRLVSEGAHFIATNPDPAGPGEGGLVPACGAMAALVETASGYSPFFVGKPNPLMMRSALNFLNVHSEDTIMIGDRMDTDIVGGVEAGMETILVLTGVTNRENVKRFPYQPTRIAESVAEIELEEEAS
ncbi:MAG: HAD-IIA family hydrolase [Chloroflexota bacterium]|nr:HAD-IIA family hydrolase [Chloroflexota bacterium]